MEELDVRIVTLEPFRAIAFHGFGPGPEGIAFEKANAWLKQTRLLEDGKPHRFFGFNHPDPSPGSPNYGYDVWITVDESVQPGGDGQVVYFSGGRYAVTRCKGIEAIAPTWKRFVQWREKSPYRFNHSVQWLEETFNPSPTANMDEVELDLYMPIIA